MRLPLLLLPVGVLLLLLVVVRAPAVLRPLVVERPLLVLDADGDTCCHAGGRSGELASRPARRKFDLGMMARTGCARHAWRGLARAKSVHAWLCEPCAGVVVLVERDGARLLLLFVVRRSRGSPVRSPVQSGRDRRCAAAALFVLQEHADTATAGGILLDAPRWRLASGRGGGLFHTKVPAEVFWQNPNKMSHSAREAL